MAFAVNGQLEENREPPEQGIGKQPTRGESPAEAEQRSRVSERRAAQAAAGDSDDASEGAGGSPHPAEKEDDTSEFAAESSGSRAKFLTGPVYFSGPKEWRVLSHGIDTLYLSLSVTWGKNWPRVMQALETGKRKATGSEGISFADGRCLVLPSGKKPCYRWHLQFPGFHVFLSKQPQALDDTPNVYVSLGSEILWKLGVRSTVDLVQSHLRDFGGTVAAIKVSRCDPCVDLLIPGGLSLPFLQAHLVPRHRDESHFQKGEVLESFYVGAKGAHIQWRLYDKGAEILQGGTKLWFLDVWKLADGRHVWRCEFRIDSLDDLERSLASLWQYLTEDWVSLRIPDNPNATRRTVHPLSITLQECAARFGTPIPLVRQAAHTEADASWYVSHVAGCLVSYAARKGHLSLEETLQALTPELRQYFANGAFAEKLHIKRIQKGAIPCDGKESDDV